MKRWLSSPLAGTAGVIAGLLVISLPLRKLTSAAPVAFPVEVAVATEKTDAVLRLKLLAPAERVVIRDSEGRTLLETRDASAGESEHDVVLDMADDGVDLELAIDGSRADGETAAFLTVMPDGREELTRYAIGEGEFGDILRFEWPHAH
jgi:hypothetical protein